MSTKRSLVDRIRGLFPRVPPSAPTSPSPGVASAKGRARWGFAYREETVTELGEAAPPLPAGTYAAPLEVSGEVVGEIQAGAGEAELAAREVGMIDGAAEMLSRRLEELAHIID
jgi:hypothetical protein